MATVPITRTGKHTHTHVSVQRMCWGEGGGKEKEEEYLGRNKSIYIDERGVVVVKVLGGEEDKGKR